MIQSKIKLLHYKYMGDFFFFHSRASNSKVNSLIWPKINHVQDFMAVLVTRKFDEDPIKNEVDILRTTGERGGSVVECRTPEREVRGSRPTAAVLCP